MRDVFFPKTMSIRVPSFATRLIAAEVAKRHFLKKNGQGNENEFFNKMLPNQLSYRAYKKEFLRDFLERTIKPSIAKGMQERVIDFLAESFDFSYFDGSEYEYDDVINLRFSVDYEDFYAELFSHLDTIGIKRSAYLRSLIIEYLAQSDYQKERICFNDEYKKLRKAAEEEIIVRFFDGQDTINAYAVALEYSAKSEHWYFLYFEENKYDVLFSVPLYRLKNILLRYKAETVPSEILSDQIHKIIESEAFDGAECFSLGDNKDA